MFWRRDVHVVLFPCLLSIACVVTDTRRVSKKSQDFQPTLLDVPSQNCDHYIPATDGPVAAILAPSPDHIENGPNITIVCCVKNLEFEGATATLHVVDGHQDYPQAAEHPISIAGGSTAIAWGFVPEGSYSAYILLKNSAGVHISHSKGVRFSKVVVPQDAEAEPESQTFSFARRHPWQQPPAANSQDSKNDIEHPVGFKGQDESGEEEEEEWPLLDRLKALAAEQKSEPTCEQDSKGRCSGEEDKLRMEGVGEGEGWRMCGWTGWEEVGTHEAVAAFLQAEWYKAEHSEWRAVREIDQAVRHPDMRNDNENVLRAMLLGTHRKVNMLRKLPLDARWLRRHVSAPSLASLHIMCEKSWGEEFGPALREGRAGLDAAGECAELNGTRMAALAEECWRTCPDTILRNDLGMDVTDSRELLGTSEGTYGAKCGRHCAKMRRIREAIRQNASAVDGNFIVMAETGGGREGPCVVLEGNHRVAPVLLASMAGEAAPTVTVYLAASPAMRSCSYYYGVAAGLDRRDRDGQGKGREGQRTK